MKQKHDPYDIKRGGKGRGQVISDTTPSALESTIATDGKHGKRSSSLSSSPSSSSSSSCGIFWVFALLCNWFGCLRVKSHQKTGATIINVKGYLVYLVLLVSFLYVLPLFLCHAPNIYQHSVLGVGSTRHAIDHSLFGDVNAQQRSEPKLVVDLIPDVETITDTTMLVGQTIVTLAKAGLHHSVVSVGKLREVVFPDWAFHSIYHTLDGIGSGTTPQSRPQPESMSKELAQTAKRVLECIRTTFSTPYLSTAMNELLGGIKPTPTTTAAAGTSSASPHNNAFIIDTNTPFLSRLQPATCTAMYSTRNIIYTVVHVTINTILHCIKTLSRTLLSILPPATSKASPGRSKEAMIMPSDEVDLLGAGGSLVQSIADAGASLYQRGINTLKRLSQFEATGLTSGTTFLRGIAATVSLVEKPSWVLHRIGKPIASGLHNLLNALLPPQEQLMAFSVAYLQTSILRASCALYIPDAIEWYETGMLYNKPTSAEELGLSTELFYSLDVSSDDHEYTTHDERLPGIHVRDLAKITCTHEESLKRLLKAAAVMGIFAEIQPNRWVNTRMSSLLVSSHAGSLHGAMLMSGNEQYIAQANLEYSVRHGRSSFTASFGDFWEYHKMSKDQELIIDTGNNAKYKQIIGRCHERIDIPTVSNTPGINHQTNALPFTQNILPLSPSLDVLAKPPHNASGSDQKVNVQNTSDDTTKTAGNASSGEKVANNEQATTTEKSIILNPVRLPIANAYGEFNQGMTSIATTVLDYITADTHLFKDADTVIDVAGGKGHLLAAVVRAQEHALQKKGLLSSLVSDAFGVNTRKGAIAGSGANGVTTGVVFDLSYTYDNPTTMKEVDELIQSSLMNDHPNARHAQSCVERETPITNRQHGRDKAQSTPNTGESSSEVPMNTIIRAFHQSGAHTSLHPQTSRKGLCKSIYVHTGSFFEPPTMPLSIDYNRDPIIDKLRQAYEHTFEAISRDVERYEGYGDSAEQVQLPVTSVSHQTIYMMMQILHDWSDEDSVRILKSIRYAMKTVAPGDDVSEDASVTTTTRDSVDELTSILCHNKDGSRKVFDNSVIDKGEGDSPSDFAFKTTIQLYCAQQQQQQQHGEDPSPVFRLQHQKKLYIIDRLILDEASNIVDSYGANYADILMLNNFNNAKERTVKQFEDILNQSGFVMTRVIPTRFMYAVVEAIPV